MTTTAQPDFPGHYPAKTVPSTTAEAVAAGDKIIATGIIIKAPTTNTLDVFIGAEGVTIADGFPVSPGGSLTLDVRDPSKVYCIAAAAGQTLRILGV